MHSKLLLVISITDRPSGKVNGDNFQTLYFRPFFLYLLRATYPHRNISFIKQLINPRRAGIRSLTSVGFGLMNVLEYRYFLSLLSPFSLVWSRIPSVLTNIVFLSSWMMLLIFRWMMCPSSFCGRPSRVSVGLSDMPNSAPKTIRMAVNCLRSVSRRMLRLSRIR